MNQKQVKAIVKKRVYREADESDWIHLDTPGRSKLYEKWTIDPDIGGLLAKFIGEENVRVFLKDSIIGQYSRERRKGIKEILRSLSITCSTINEEFVKPVGLVCDARSMYTVCAAKQWKTSLINVHERAHERPMLKTKVLFITDHLTGRYVDETYKQFINEVGERLAIKVWWLD